MKKLFGLLIAIVMVVALVGCRENTSKKLKVGLIGSAAGLNDKGYNQFAVDGLKKAEKEFDITTKTVDITSGVDINKTLDQFGQQKYDLVFLLEYNFDGLITSYNNGKPIAEKYPNTQFVIFNAFANTNEQGNKIHSNVTEVLFGVNESSYLAGMLAVLAYENRDIFIDNTYLFPDNRALAFVGGTNSEGITVFSYGFYQGANAAAHEAGVTYDIYETYEAGFGASTEMAQKIKGYYDNGVSTVYGAAGGVASNIRTEAETAKRFMVDVDANQDELKPGYVLTSVLKKTDAAVYELIKELKNKTFEGGKVRNYNLANSGTDITDLSTISRFIKEEKTAKWNEIKRKIRDAKTAIINGTIDVIDAQNHEVLDKTTLTNLNFR